MTEQEKIDRACHVLMTDPDLSALRLWWEATALRTRMPEGPVDPLRLAMAQGDRERFLMVLERAGRWQKGQAAK